MLLAADNLQITSSAIARAVEECDPDPVRMLVQQCERAGADVIDINPGPLSSHAERKMTFLVETVQSTTDLPILIDTANPHAMEAGLAASKKQAVINGCSLEPKRLDAFLPLAKQYEADIIGYLLHPDGQVPRDSAQRLSVAVELFTAAQKAGIERHHLILDPVLVPLVWENGCEQAVQVLDVLRNLADVLGFPVRTIVGLSNLTSGQSDRAKKMLVESAFLPILAGAGLNILLMNMLHRETVRIAMTTRKLLSKRVFSFVEIE